MSSNFKQVLLNSTEIGFMQMYLLNHPFIDCAQLLTIHIYFIYWVEEHLFFH